MLAGIAAGEVPFCRGAMPEAYTPAKMAEKVVAVDSPAGAAEKIGKFNKRRLLMRGNKSVLCSCVVSAVILVAVYALTAMTPYLADDYGCMAAAYADNPLPAGVAPSWSSFFNLEDIWNSCLSGLKCFWYMTNGRFLADICFGTFVILPKGCFDVVNAIQFLLLIWLIWIFCGIGLRWFPAVAFLCVWIFPTVDATHWLCGATNYLWAAVAGGYGALFFTKYRPKGVFGAVLCLAVGIFAAGWHELVTIILGFGLFIFWCSRLVQERKITFDSHFWMSLGFLIGSLACLFSPGCFRRADGGAFFAVNESVFFWLLKGCGRVVKTVQYAPTIIAGLIMVMLVIVRKKWRERLRTVDSYLMVLYLFSIGLVFFVFHLSGFGRQTWIVTVLSVPLCVSLARILYKDIPVSAFRIVTISVCLIGVFSAIVTISHSYSTRAVMMNATQEWLHNEYDTMKIPTLKKGCMRLFDHSLSPRWMVVLGVGDPWQNRALARFYGKMSCIGLTEDLFSSFILQDPLSVYRELPDAPGWYGCDQLDAICSPISEDIRMANGDLVECVIEYDKASLKYDWRALLEDKIFGVANLDLGVMPPMQEMLSSPVKPGFVLNTRYGKFLVVLLDKRIPRDKIIKVNIMHD